MTETRKLAAILVSDVVGYSRLAGADEEGVLARLRALRRELIDPKIALHNGRIVKSTGDGVIVEFRSAVDAVRAAIEVQTAMVDRNAGIPEDKQIVFRIGVHVGDVIEESDSDLMGDGVNIAARLEGVAKPGAICLSEDAYRQVKARLDLAITDLGETKLKNIAEPIRAYALQVGVAAAPKPAPPAPAEKPSIAALPFQNMSGDPDQEYFVDGLVEDIITGLSRIKSLLVIARNSSFVYKGKAVDIRQVGCELGVRYVLEGSVRKGANRLRINVQLIEAETGAHLWADKFDGGLADLFDLQDQVTEQVVGVIEPSVRRSEIERSRRKHPQNLSAYDLYLRALPHMPTAMPADARVAALLLEDALRLDPNFAAAHAQLAHCHEICFLRAGRDPADLAAALMHAEAALASGTDDATTLSTAAFVISMLGADFDAAVGGIERALSFNPSCAAALIWGAWMYCVDANAAMATLYADRALRLSPIDPFAWLAHCALAVSAMVEDRYDEAVSQSAKMVQLNPRFVYVYPCQAVALALAGRTEDAKAVVRKLFELDPTFRFGHYVRMYRSAALVDKFLAGWRLLGLPE